VGIHGDGEDDMLRIGWIDYANCTPIFSALTRHFDCSNYAFVKGVPAELNAMLAEGRIDVAPSSSIEYAIHEDRYVLMPGLSISSVGPVKSVLLFSRKPLEELNHHTIGLTPESAASVVLLKILLAEHMGFSNVFERTVLLPVEAIENYDALLLIGDAALRATLSLRGYHVYDLGALWYQMCHLPFVFALWIVRRDVVQKRFDEAMQLWQDLTAARNIARDEYAEIAADCSCREWLGLDGLIAYWNTISYDLGIEHLEGLKLYYHYAAEMGILARPPEIRLLHES
jgi:chorismate dehydratase